MSPRYRAARSDSRKASRIHEATSLRARSPWMGPRLRLNCPRPSTSINASEKRDGVSEETRQFPFKQLVEEPVIVQTREAVGKRCRRLPFVVLTDPGKEGRVFRVVHPLVFGRNGTSPLARPLEESTPSSRDSGGPGSTYW